MSSLPVQVAEAADPRACCPNQTAYTSSGTWLIEMLLREQATLPAVETAAAEPAAVERFASQHAMGELAREAAAATDDAAVQPALASHYRALLPATPPGPGQQYAFEVDLDRCSGCKACVAACHALNGLDEHETWRDVGLLVGGTSSAPVLQHVTTACHHCLEPACMIACPVEAYVKDPITGIVKHLDDQCFGCQYCTLACPYDVPKYHASLGIVRKCDMCSARLSVGQAPACVQACPHEAIRIQLVDLQQVADETEVAQFLPAAPDPQFTLPTTSFRTRRSMPRNMLPADYYELSPQHPHWPLVVMLVLTQLSVGAFGVSAVLNQLLPRAEWTPFQPIQAGLALCVGLLALAASVLHLGRPLLAWRGILGMRHSWLSREILAFGLFALLATLYFAAVMVTAAGTSDLHAWLRPGAAVVSAMGAIGLFCSVMIYAFTRRVFWSLGRTSIRFGLTAVLLGTATVWLSLVLQSLWESSSALLESASRFDRWLAQALLTIAAAKLFWEAALFRHLASRHMSCLKRSALLAVRRLPRLTLLRFVLGGMGGMILPLVYLHAFPANAAMRPVAGLVYVALILTLTMAGELLERCLFFAAVAAPRMPGSVK